MISETLFYNRNANFSRLHDFAGPKDCFAGSICKSAVWQSPPTDWLECTDASRVEKNSRRKLVMCVGIT